MLNTIQKEERKAELDLASVQYKIDDLEFRRLRDLANVPMQMKLINLMKQYNKIQSYIDFRKKDDDDFLIMVMSIGNL